MILDEHLIKNQKNKEFKFSYLFIIFCVIPYLFGVMFKIMHWPGANIMILSGLAMVSAYSLSAFLRLGKSSTTCNIFAALSLYILGKMILAQFIDFNFPYNTLATHLFWTSFLVSFLIFELLFQVKYKKSIFTPKELFSNKN